MGMFDITIENSTLASKPWKFGNDYWSSFELYPEWTGNTFYVFRGIAHHRRDYMSRTEVVVKTFKTLDGTPDDWRSYLETNTLANDMALEFNKHLSTVRCLSKVRFVKPTDVVMDNISDVMYITRILLRFNKRFSDDETVVFEDCLDGNFKTFVSATGEPCGNGTGILDAYSHFTYHQSGGHLVVCNLKGVAVENDEFALTNPVIHSRSGKYSAKDKRDVGILDFFNNHVCTGVCDSFLKPEVVESSETEVKPSAPSVDSLDDTSTSCDGSDDQLYVISADVHGPPVYTPNDPLTPPPYSELCAPTTRKRVLTKM